MLEAGFSLAIDAAKLAIRITVDGVDRSAQQLRSLGMQIDQSGQKAQGAARGHDQLGKSTQQAGQQAGGAAKQAAGLGAALGGITPKSMLATAGIAGVGVAAVGAARGAVRAGIDFEQAFTGVIKTVDGTEQQFAELERGIRDMATTIPVAATEIAGIASAAGQLGIEVPNILEFTRVMADLGVATNMSAEEAATALARMANITGMAQTDFDRLGATIVELGNNLATTESEITQMALRIAGAGTQIGLTEAQILGFAGALSSVGIEAQAGGSAISRTMIAMASAVATGSEELELFAEVAGMSASQFQQAFQEDAAGAIVTFIEGLSGISNAGENVFAMLEELGLSEIRVRDALLRASNAGDLFRDSIDRGSRAWEENIALTKEAELYYDTTANKLQILKNQASEAAIEGFEILGPAIREAAEMLGEFVVSIPPALQGLSDFITEVQRMRDADVSERTGLEGFLAAAGSSLDSASPTAAL